MQPGKATIWGAKGTVSVVLWVSWSSKCEEKKQKKNSSSFSSCSHCYCAGDSCFGGHCWLQGQCWQASVVIVLTLWFVVLSASMIHSGIFTGKIFGETNAIIILSYKCLIGRRAGHSWYMLALYLLGFFVLVNTLWESTRGRCRCSC